MTNDTLALRPPPNHERARPTQIPTNHAKFKAWADYACVEWPSDLMVAGADAWGALVRNAGGHWYAPGRDNAADIQKFAEMYTAWWSASEEAKGDMMTLEQRESPQRDYYRRQARGYL